MSLQILDSSGQPFNQSMVGARQINFGKTKLVYQLPDGNFAIDHKSILTAYDKPEFTGNAPGKGTASAYSSAVLFKRLQEKGVLTAHRGFINNTTTLEEGLDMLPFEIIWRTFNIKGNSWEDRNPKQIELGQRYPEVKFEIGLKYSVIAEDGEVCNDPFLMLDKNYEPILNEQGLPRLMHQKKPGEIRYTKFIHPNKNTDISTEHIRAELARLKKHIPEIIRMAGIIQETTHDTYAQVGRLNADGKFEVGTDTEGKLRLGDELELDAMRNVSLKEVMINGQKYTYTEDLIGQDLHTVMRGSIDQVNRILDAAHSGKQHFRDQVAVWRDHPFDDERKGNNDRAAVNTTNTIYVPVALALSDRFADKVGYRLVHTN